MIQNMWEEEIHKCTPNPTVSEQAPMMWAVIRILDYKACAELAHARTHECIGSYVYTNVYAYRHFQPLQLNNQ